MFLRNRIILVFSSACLAFIPAAALLPRHYLFDMVNAFTIAVAAGSVYAYWPAVVDICRRLRKRVLLENGHFLALADILILLAVASRTIWLEAWRSLDLDDAFLYHALFALMAWMIVPSAVLHMASPQILNGEIPRNGWSAIRWALASGAILFAAFATFRWARS